ncbi:MAG: tRNA (adenosine(37)-N6)-threonylcarbamoyltransferase complex dimerization subunit type 1 TsaB [Candidatus Gastranaerophilales bacterium]|nr:tRNA (adenosine(37)-N6)-threonylcarbamoyltransferase complex dimerization subunit type 1 TsaB [Candidatus Gastranaerophilales bacterium]
MRILVFDTCFNKTYIVLKDNDKFIANERIASTDLNYHSAYLIPALRDILKKNNFLISDIDAIGVNIGPGSFTGIRASVTIARVLAQQAGLKLVAVPSLEILSKFNNNKSDTIVILDARKNKVYFAEYKENNILTHPYLEDKDILLSKINSTQTIVSDSSISYFLSKNNIKSINYEENDENIGLYLCKITEKKLLNCKDEYNWAEVKPLYIQKPSITKPKVINNV